MNPRRSSLRAAGLACLSLLALLGPARAAEQTGKMMGTVYAPDGALVPSAPVRLSSESLMGQRRGETASDGTFLFYGLPPGNYRVEVSSPGFLPYVQDELRVFIGGTVTLDILLVSAAADETVVVTSRRPLVDREKTSLGQSYDEAFLDDVPIGRSYQSVARLAPGVVTASDSGNPNIHGGAFFENQYLLDGINTTDPVSGTFAANINYNAIKEFQILSAGLDAEYGQAMGGVINLVTKSGGNRFQLDTSLYWQPDFLNLKEDFERDAAGQNDAISANVNLGGPILKDRLWYFGSVELKRLQRGLGALTDVFDPSNPDPRKLPERDWTSVYYLGKLTYQVSERHKLIFLLQGDPYWVENELQSPMVRADAEQQRVGSGAIYTLTWEALWSPRLFQKTQLGLTQSGIHMFAQSGCTAVDNPDCQGHLDKDYKTYYGNTNQDVVDQRHRLQFDSSLTAYLPHLLGSHEWKTGLQYFHTWATSEETIPGGGYYEDRAGKPYRFVGLARDEQGRLAGVQREVKGDTASAFLQESWKIGRRLILRPGVRLDYATNRDDRGRLVTEFLTLSPRMNVVWDVAGDGKTVLRLGYNRYVDSGALYLSNRVSNALPTETFDYNPATDQYDIPYRSDGGKNSVFLRKGFTAPHTDEIDFQIERELAADFSVGLAGVWREFKFLFESAETNYVWNQEGTNVIGYHNGEVTPVYGLGTFAEARRRYWALELLVRKALRNRWQMEGSYTFSRSEGTTESQLGTFMDNYRQNDLFWGFSSFDRRHVLKLMGSYRFPWGLTLGSTFSWATGFPFNQWSRNDYTAGYSILHAPRGYDPDHPDDPYWNRYPDQLRINVKVLLDLQRYTGQKLELFSEVQNLLNLRNKTAVEEHVTPPGSPTHYGEFQAYGPGLQAAVGLRYRY